MVITQATYVLANGSSRYVLNVQQCCAAHVAMFVASMSDIRTPTRIAVNRLGCFVNSNT